MGVLAWGASEWILAALVAVAGGAALWLVGHEVEKDVEALGAAVPKILNPGVLIAVIVVAWLVTRSRK